MKKLRRSEISANRAGCSLKCRTHARSGSFEPVPQQNEKPPDRYRAVMRSLFDPLLHVHAASGWGDSDPRSEYTDEVFHEHADGVRSSMGSAFF